MRILDGDELVCEHERTYDKGAVIEDEAHVAELRDAKRRARKGRVKDRLVRAAPTTEMLFEELARRGANLGSRVTALERLLDEFGAERLERAVREALLRDTPEPTSVRLVLERERLEAGLEPRVPVALPDDPRLQDLAVRPASLAGYGVLRDGGDEQESDHDEAADNGIREGARDEEGR